MKKRCSIGYSKIKGNMETMITVDFTKMPRLLRYNTFHDTGKEKLHFITFLESGCFVPQSLILPVQQHQFLMGALLNDFSILYYDDSVCRNLIWKRVQD